MILWAEKLQVKLHYLNNTGSNLKGQYLKLNIFRKEKTTSLK